MKKIIFSIAIFSFIFISANCTQEEPMDLEEPPIAPSFGTVEKYGRTWLPYAIVEKSGDYARHMFVEADQVEFIRENGTLPDGTLIAMETWFGESQSTVYIRTLIDNEWQSGQFNANAPNYSVSVRSSCNACHSNASSRQDNYTRDLIQRAIFEQTTPVVYCDQPSFNPCELSVYQ
ncbi:MAG: hypothetical protein AAGD05_14375 [Bacteroidota bacterium]